MKMKAAVHHAYGPPEVVHVVELDKPTPKPNEVLIKTHATTVTSADWRLRSLNVPAGFGLATRLMFGITKPRHPILGSEIAGVIEAVGAEVKRFKVGDPVFAFSETTMGCHAEYKCIAEDASIAHKSANLSYPEAAALSFGGTTALSFLNRGNLQPGETILINGASGCVGSAAVQLAKHFGAHVTGVCSTANIKLAKSLGADEVTDYTQQDVLASGKTYELVMDTVGNIPYSQSRALLKDDGRLLMVVGGLPDMMQIPWIKLTSKQKVIASPATGTAEDLRLLADLAEAGRFKPVIDRSYPLDQIVESHRYVDTGRKKGNVVITLEQNK
ncbi:MAG: NAD(P)-dependent alcohol dehydrogenase [Burkholderiaceae bacterium]